MATVTMPAWATKTTQDAAKAVIDDTNARVRALQQQATPIGPVRYHIAVQASGGNALKWHDPNDTVIYGVPAAYWARTVIVRRDDGAYPTSPTDGTVVVTETVRNQYLHMPFLDEGGTSTSLYRAFPIATSGFVNMSADNQFDTSGVWTFGYILDQENDNPATCITYIEDNTDFAPLSMDFTNDVCDWGDWKTWYEEYFRPAMLTYGGEVDYYLNQDNLAEKADGTASDVANSSYGGNAMLIVKPIYYNIKRTGMVHEIRFSNVQQTEEWECWTHKKSDGTYAPFCGWPLFEGSVISSRLRSIATGAKPGNTTTQQQEYDYATANGTGWYTTTYADEMMFRLLFPLFCRTLNSQAAIGSSFVSGVSALQFNCGAAKDKGAFWGKYFDGSANVAYPTKFLGMENIWAHRGRRCAGVAFINGVWYVKFTPSTVDGSAVTGFLTADNSDYTHSYIDTEAEYMTSANTTYIGKMHMDGMSVMLPAEGGGSSATHFCDASFSAAGVRCFQSGGRVSIGLGAGVFASDVFYAPSLASWIVGASPSYHEP